MVGEGINGAVALAQADVGIACGAVANLAQETSDLMLLSEGPSKVMEVLQFSPLTIRQNLLLAFVYNLVAVPLAVTGMVNPMVAVCAMFAGSLTLIGNTCFRMSSKNAQVLLKAFCGRVDPIDINLPGQI